MKKLLLIAAVGFVVVVAMLLWAIDGIYKTIDETSEEYKELVGEKIIIDKDTLLVTDYSVWLRKFYLSNGSEVSKEYAKKKVIKN